MPRLLGFFWKVTGTRPGCNCRTYFCHIAKTAKDAKKYAEEKGWRNVEIEKWSNVEIKKEIENANAANVQGLTAVPVLSAVS